MKYLTAFLGIVLLTGCGDETAFNQERVSKAVAVPQLEAAYECTDWIATGLVLEGSEASRAVGLALGACREYYDDYARVAYRASDVEDSTRNSIRARFLVRQRAEQKFIETFGNVYTQFGER